jgi:transcriptional regulator with XRE-family HTH domain
MQPAPQTEKSLGQLIEKRRLEISATRLKIAAAAGISANYYGAIERGSITPPNSTLAKIIRALQLKSDDVPQLLELAALNRGLQREDAGLPDEVSGLIVDIRRAAFVMPTRFVRALRARIREISH